MHRRFLEDGGSMWILLLLVRESMVAVFRREIVRWIERLEIFALLNPSTSSNPMKQACGCAIGLGLVPTQVSGRSNERRATSRTGGSTRGRLIAVHFLGMLPGAGRQ